MRRVILLLAIIGLVSYGAVSLANALYPPSRCSVPNRLRDGAYSSYSASDGHTMPSGRTVRLSDGDLWSCHNGTVTVR